MKQNFQLLLLLIALLLSTSCSSNSPAELSDLEKDFFEKFPYSDMNQSLQLKLDSNNDTFLLDTKIPFLIYNTSSRSVLIIDSNLNIKLLLAGESGWQEIDNALSYSGGMHFSPSGTPLLDVRYSWSQPVLGEDVLGQASDKIMVRIFIIGELVDNNEPTGEFAGAYVDVFIEKP